MTPTQIAIEIGIGLMLLVVGALLRKPLEHLVEWIQRPSPLTPHTRGQVTEQLANTRAMLAHVNHMNAHPRDLYLYLLQLILAVLFCEGGAFWISTLCQMETIGCAKYQYHVLSFILITFGLVFAIIGIVEGKRLSQRHIDKTRNHLEERIAKLERLLSEPTE